jgi:hypothetical protein
LKNYVTQDFVWTESRAIGLFCLVAAAASQENRSETENGKNWLSTPGAFHAMIIANVA